jgi:anti-sigma B factor antagonist
MADPTPFGVETVGDGDHVRVAVRGELDLLAAPRLRAALLDATQDGAATIRLDLSAATFIDSTGISVILQAWQRANAAGGRLVLDAASPVVTRVFEVAGLAELFALNQ